MKYFPYASLFALLVPVSSAQFGALTPLYPTTRSPAAKFIDVDGDGTLDLVILEQNLTSDISVSWIRLGGGFPLSAPQPIAIVPGALLGSVIVASIDGGDINGDGFVDLVMPTTVGLVQILGGPGQQFTGPMTIDPTPCGQVEVLDLDMDGDLDLAKFNLTSTGPTDDMLLINDGAGVFTPLMPLPFGPQYFVPLMTDADLDGDIDILVGAAGVSLAYYENLGSLNFAGATRLPPTFNGTFVGLGDVDEDGDDDLLYSNFVNGPAGWLENTGGAFTVDRVIDASTSCVSAPRVGDVDGDGDLDFVLVEDIGVGTGWYPNDGTNQFLQRLSVAPAVQDSVLVDLVDVDGDRALDIVFSSGLSAGVNAYRNISLLGSETCVAAVNSTGVAASLRASGSRSAAVNQFALTLQNAPPGQFAAAIVGQVAQLSTPAGSAGLLCLGAPFGIFRGPSQIGQIDPGGAFLIFVDLSAIPAGAGVQAVQSGQTWLFQSWFRDATPLGASNLSPAIEVTFVP